MKNKSIITSLILTVFLILLSCLSVNAATETNQGDGNAISYSSSVSGATIVVGCNGSVAFGSSGASYSTGVYTVNGHSAVCSWAVGRGFNPGVYSNRTKYYIDNTSLRAKAFYWLLVSPTSTLSNNASKFNATCNTYADNISAALNSVSDSFTEPYGLVHVVIDRIQQGKYSGITNSTYNAMVTKLINTINNYPVVPNNYKIFYTYPSNDVWKQSLMSYEVTGFLKVEKQSANPTATDNNASYSLGGAKYGIYKNASCSNSSYIGYVITDTNGIALSQNGSTNAVKSLELGTYYVKEQAASQGFELDTSVHTVVVTESNNQNNPAVVISEEPPKQAYINIIKSSSNPTLTDGDPRFSFEGIQYLFFTDENDAQTSDISTYASLTSYIGSITLNADGTGNNTVNGDLPTIKNLYAGTYYIREFFPSAIASSCGYTLDETVHTVNLTTEYTLEAPFALEVTNTPRGAGHAKIVKRSTNPEITTGSSCYSLKGAEFSIYRTRQDANNKVNAIAVLRTNAYGEALSGDMQEGRYFVRETKAPKGFKIDNRVYPIHVELDETTVLNISDEPELDPVSVLLRKVDAATGTVDPSVDMSGAEYTVKYYSAYYDTVSAIGGIRPERTWVLATGVDGYVATDSAHFVSGDSFYTDPNTGDVMFPYGTITIQETKTPPVRADRTTTFKFDETIHLIRIDENGLTYNGTIIESTNEATIPTSNEVVIQPTSIKVIKNWADSNNADGVRPNRITVYLYQDGNLYDYAVLSASNSWSYVFTDLPKGYADMNVTGHYKEYSYTIGEVLVDNYESTVGEVVAVSGKEWDYECTVVNRHSREAITISGEKQWKDYNDLMGIRPASIRVLLYKNGTLFRTQKTSAMKNWRYEFTNLDKYENGNEITYSIGEEPVAGYDDPDIYGTYLIQNPLKTGQVTLCKIDEKGNNALNAEFSLHSVTLNRSVKVYYLYDDENGNKVYTFSELVSGPNLIGSLITKVSGNIIVTGLPAGDYYFLEDYEPDGGYMRYTDRISFTIDLDESPEVTVTAQNYKNILPDTGGIGNLIYYSVAISFAVIAVFLIILLIVKKDKKKNRKTAPKIERTDI